MDNRDCAVRLTKEPYETKEAVCSTHGTVYAWCAARQWMKEFYRAKQELLLARGVVEASKEFMEMDNGDTIIQLQTAIESYDALSTGTGEEQ